MKSGDVDLFTRLTTHEVMSALDGLTPEQLAQTPAGVPPPGVIPNLVNPYSESYILITVGGVLMVTMFLFVALRLYVKMRVQRKFTGDDCKWLSIHIRALIAVVVSD